VTAPYDGVITVRNANTGDYVLAATGDRSATNLSAIFVVARTDILRIFVDVPERYSGDVKKGTKAVVRAKALSGLEIPATVTRTSWAIRQNTRTLWTEIDLTVKQYDGLRPGMYVYTKVLVERSHVFALPQQALTVSGNQTYCYLLRSNKAVKTSAETGISDGTWTEVTKMQIGKTWRDVTGNEEVIVGDLDELTDGQTVRLAK
jgi:RND family efflux transporter MFP subunit